jgi:hypothetical protein
MLASWISAWTNSDRFPSLDAKCLPFSQQIICSLVIIT